MPTKLKQVIERAHSTMLSHPEHILMPFYRRAIYETIEVSNAAQARYICGWLAVITAEFVRDIWQKELPNNELPTQLINAAKSVLKGEIQPEQANSIAEHGWNELEDLANEPLHSSRAYYAGEAAVQALAEALGGEPFDSLDIDETTSNSDLDPGTADTAFYGSIAYARREIWQPFATTGTESPSSTEERKVYWEWWLLKAIPEAWEIGA